MHPIQRLDPNERMSEAVICGDRLYTCGLMAWTTVGQPVYEQTVDVLGQLDELLARAGTDKTNILKANIWLADMKDFAEMNRAWDAWVVPNQAPARATVESKLAGEGYAVEIMIEAFIPSS